MAMGADYSFELIFIETYVPWLIGHNKLFLGSVSRKQALRAYCSNIYAVQKGYVCETTPDFAYELEYDEEILCFNKSVPMCAKVRAKNA